MSLTTDDVQLIGRMLDERLDRIQEVARRRRRRLWLIILLLTLASTVASVFAAREALRMYQDFRSEQDQAMIEAKLAYQRELARNDEMRKEREAAVAASGYQPKQDQANYEAGLIRSLFKTMSQQTAMQKRLENLDPEDPDALLAATEDMQTSMTEGLGAITRILLRNTDPALNTAQERLLAGADGGPPEAASPAALPKAPDTPQGVPSP